MGDWLRRYEKSEWERIAEEDPGEHWKRRLAEDRMEDADPELYALYKKNEKEAAQLERLKTIQSFLKVSTEMKRVTGEIEQLMYEVIDSAPQSMIDRIISYLDSSR